MENKKYFSIDEVAIYTGIEAHKLRYLEKTDANFPVYRIRNRRYYTKDNIETIKNKFGFEKNSNFNEILIEDDSLIFKINNLIEKFQRLIE